MIPRFNFVSEHRDAYEAIEAEARANNQEDALRQEVDYLLGIMALSNTDRADFVNFNRLLAEAMVFYSREKHKNAERIMCDFILQLVVVMQEAQIAQRYQPYLVQIGRASCRERV